MESSLSDFMRRLRLRFLSLDGLLIPNPPSNYYAPRGSLQHNFRHLNSAIIHLLLPKRTPGCLQPDLEDTEEFLLQAFCNTITKVCTEIQCPPLEATRVMLEKWVQIQPKSDDDNFQRIIKFQQHVSTISCGETLPLYVRKQNATFLITKLMDGSIKIATFRTSLPSETVMSTVGSLSFNFPETDEIIHNVELLESQAFASLLYELATRSLELSQGKTTKGGHEYKETRDVVDTFLVSDWCIGVLVPGLKSFNPPQHQIQKKIRDQVTLSDSMGSSKLLPFRRSGMYLSLKASLQLKLLDVLGSANQANLIYKILLLQILTDIMEQYCEWSEADGVIDIDLASQMLSKLGIRAFKLDNMTLVQNDELLGVVTAMKARCLLKTEVIVERLRTSMSKVWDNVAKPLDNALRTVLEERIYAGQNETFQEKDLHHQLPLIDRFIEKLKTVRTSFSPRTLQENISTAESQALQRYPTIDSIEASTVSSNQLHIWLYDTENFIKYQCESIPVARIFSLMTKYVERARNHYHDNPLGMSQLLLVTLKAVELIDRATTKNYPLLLEYESGVGLGVFDKLLLPYLKDMNMMEELLSYFRNRDTRATCSGILNDATVKVDTFSARFASQNENMIQLREQILQHTVVCIQRKFEEVNSTRKKCQELQKQIRAEGLCKCKYGTNVWDELIKISTCLKCNFEERLSMLRKSISYYERPLPPQEMFQNSVIFELLLPDEFAIWRDSMAFFKFTVLGEPIFQKVNNSISLKWLEYKSISSYKGEGVTGVSSTSLCLGSTKMPASSTYHTRIGNLDVLSNQKEKFIINNGMNCTYHYDATGSPMKWSNNTFAFQLTTTSNNAPYLNLQDTLTSTSQTQNNIIARQYECHQKLALHEFIAFGSLRCGHRIQLRNLFSAIFSGTLSMEQEPVLALVLQTIWQVGPRDLENVRESHVDFHDSVFAQEFLDMLDKLVKNNEANYSNSLIMLIAVIITRRIADLNAQMQGNCYNVLKGWRNIMAAWINKIQEVLDKPETSSIYGGVASLQKNLLEVLLCSLFSFNIADQSSLNFTILKETDVVFWLQTLYQLHQLEHASVNTSKFFKTLLEYAKLIPLRLRLESMDQLFLLPMLTFIEKQWNKAKECTIEQLEFPLADKHKEHILLAEYLETDMETSERIHHHVTFDFYKGTFLVNGHSQTTLSSNVRNNKLFVKFFNKDGTILRVQKDNLQVTRTVTKYRERHYEFIEATAEDDLWGMIGMSNETGDYVIIKEISDDTSKLILLDPSKFSSCLSQFFITNYTHWLDSTKNIVYFRPLDGDQEDYSSDYQLEKLESSSAWKLVDVRSGEQVLSIDSIGFGKLTERLERLEKSCYINITYNPSNFVITAYLRRYNLRFTTGTSVMGNLKSVEYPDYYISRNQTDMGTLVGLDQGLLMVNKEQKRLLLPHSSVSVTEGTFHQKVTLSLGALRQPPCFAYDFDDELKRLKAPNSKSAWLYLAALHAVTSSTLPDPFTEVTGTEMAVRILQAACVYPCFPYDNESMTTLQFIKQLSPQRNYYGYSYAAPNQAKDKGSYEIPNWPQGLPSMAAYDGFAIIVDQLLAESKKLSMLHPKTVCSIKREECSERLRIRAYSRYLTMYNSAVTVQSPNYFTNSQLLLLNGSLEALTQGFLLRRSSEKTNLPSLQTIAYARLTKTLGPLQDRGIFQKKNLSEFLLVNEPLDVPYPKISLDSQAAFDGLLHSEFRLNWLRLYSMATSCSSKEDFDLYSVVLSALAYRGAPMHQVANLHCISLFKGIFPSVSKLNKGAKSPGTYQCYSDPTSNYYDVLKIESILRDFAKPFTALASPSAPCEPSKYSLAPYRLLTGNEFKVRQKKYKVEYTKYEKDLREYERQKNAYEARISTSILELSRHFKKYYWPGQNIPSEVATPLLERRNIHSRAIQGINKMMAFWFHNYKLKLLVKDVEQKLATIFDDLERSADFEISETIVVAKQLSKITSRTVEKKSNFQLEMENFLNTLSLRPKCANDAAIIFENRAIPQSNVNVSTARIRLAQQEFCQKIEHFITEILRMLTGGKTCKRILYLAGLSPRLDPTSILNYLMRYINKSGEEAKIIADYAGALGVLWTNLKRINRCLRAQNTTDMQQELENPGHQNWSPKQFPEWLLLELELDIMIRPIQVDVAKQMMNMPNGGNGVTQLNMGEGKTSVIVPMLCCVLAKKNSQLCRITVLSSMFTMNLRSLTFAIGGLVNRRVYSVPCRRDMEIDEMCIARIDQLYKECLEMQGIVLTLPEYRLSFRLLAYDKILKKDGTLGQRILGIENFLRKYARDVLDESDELFQVKYQLVYTIGEQVGVDGGSIRWAVCQQILGIVQDMGRNLLNKYTSSMVEFDAKSNEDLSHEFSTFRLLNTTEDFIDEFLGTIADKILEEVMISNSDKKIVKQFLTQNKVDWLTHKIVISAIFKDSPDLLNKILLVSGYLRRGVLVLALTKRWRVEYGVNPIQGYRRMAIPFQAKDVAKEKTEFGHPDLAIVMTHLSYYYSGLDDGQLNEVFEILKGKESPDAIYSSWLSEIPDKRRPDFLRKYYSLNMKDAYQKSQLFDMLRSHKMVVDFWLSHCVFPRESKQFPGKLVMTAWDLCYERQRFPVTGFSGTNGSKILLPLMISQQDLPELESTNLKMEETLLLPENTNHKGFRMGVTCKEILMTMKKDTLTVLIDSGALMLECSNEQVADLWLEVDASIEAAVYFSKDNELLVKCRGGYGQGTPFDVSPFQGRLEKCGVFLDDQHTRGTDLKFPVGSKACVTIATRMKRDKLIQACMRMRKLGQGHSVTFYLSHEAYDNVLEMQEISRGKEKPNPQLSTKAVLQWVSKNTNEFNIDGLLYWALAGRNYAQRLAAEDNFHSPHALCPFELAVEDARYTYKAEILANQCVDDEVVKIRDMYGQHMQTELLSKIIPQWFAFTKRNLKIKNNDNLINFEAIWRFNEISFAVQKKCAENAPNKKHLVSSTAAGIMEEEQEKELELEKEVEMEEEREVERPKRAIAAIHKLHPYVKRVVVSGAAICVEQSCGSILRLCDVFKSTSFWDQVQPQCWKSCGVFATMDFISVIREVSFYHITDSYLRPIQYMISTTTKEPSASSVRLLLLSPYEVNELMPYCRSGHFSKLHMFSLRRTENQDMLLNNIRLQLPVSAAGSPSRVISDGSQAFASLLLASGNLYFASKEEQEAFAQFLGLVPQPWSPREREMFEYKMITKSGFSLPQYRNFLSDSRHHGVGFDTDPVLLVKKILLCRHSVISEVTHVMRLLEKKSYVKLN